MKLHELGTPAHKKQKRIARGGKRGTTSGRGQKGQKSRSGSRMRPAVRDLLIRIPKLRGFRNKPQSAKSAVLSVGTLARALRPLREAKKTLSVDLTTLKEMKLLPIRYRGAVKVLGDGDIDFAIALKGIGVSAGAKAKIEKAGGRVT